MSRIPDGIRKCREDCYVSAGGVVDPEAAGVCGNTDGMQAFCDAVPVLEDCCKEDTVFFAESLRAECIVPEKCFGAAAEFPEITGER